MLSGRARRQMINDLQVAFPSWEYDTLADILNSVSWDKEAATKLLQQWAGKHVEPEQQVWPRLNPVSPFVPLTFEMPSSFETQFTAPMPIERRHYDRVVASRLHRRHGSLNDDTLAVAAKVTTHWRHNTAAHSTPKEDLDTGRAGACGPLACELEVHRKMNALSREAQIVERKEILRQRCAFLGFEQYEIEDDGNCQFRAISRDLYGTQQHHELVRAVVVAYLEKHEAEYKVFVGEEEWHPYLENMAKSKTWGDEITLRAAVDALGIQIHVVTSAEDNYLLDYCPSGDTTEDTRHVFLTYVAPVHYNTIRPLR